MNRVLLLIAMASLIMMSAGAQEKSLENAKSQNPQLLTLTKYQILTQEMKIDAPAQVTSGPHKSSGPLTPHYYRPAGAFFSVFYAYYGQGFWSFGDQTFLQVKPYSDYTYYGFVEGADENDYVCWDYTDNVFGDSILSYTERYDLDIYSVPTLYAYPNGDWSSCYTFKYPYFNHDDGGWPVVIDGSKVSPLILATPTPVTLNQDVFENCELLLSSKTMIPGGCNGDKEGVFKKYYGPVPWGDNIYGWWLGKNASHIDGIAQAFEKPQHPYLLKNVYLQADFNSLIVNAPVELTCKVYRLDEIPDYQEVGCVELPDEPGELIITGKAIVTPTTAEALNGLITFTLFDQDPETGLPFESHPTIDYPILVCIDGYNDPGMEDLVDFTAYASADDQVDEGYGELAYLKTGIFEVEIDENGDTVYDEIGNPVKSFTGEYKWKGLNNYFGHGTETMKTGISIFIGLEHPYLTFRHDWEDGEYLFPREGGSMSEGIIVHPDDDGVWDYEDIEGIDFRSWMPSQDGNWTVDCNGKELPEWLEIELTDVDDNGENIDYVVIARVTAKPLPPGIDYREAIVRFAIPGDYKDFKFMQGEKNGDITGDVNDDREVNVSDVNCLIDIILGHENIYGIRADVNGDGEINIADVNLVIDLILGS